MRRSTADTSDDFHVTSSPLAPSSARDQTTRPATLVVFVGAPGTGKTSLGDEYVRAYAKSGRDVRILDPGHNFPGVGEWPENGDVDGWIAKIVTERKKAIRKGAVLAPMLIMLDDADIYLPKTPHRTSPWRDLFASFRHSRLDILVNARRSQDLPLLIFTSAKYVVLFTTREVHSLDYLRSYIGDDIVREIPREPFVYVLVDIDAHTFTRGRTKKRGAVVAPRSSSLF